MTKAEPLRIYVEHAVRKAVERGNHNFLHLLIEVVQETGFKVEFRPNSLTHRLAGHADSAFGLTHMKDPVGPNGLVFRRVYHRPFWQIERVAERWNWNVAQTVFEPDQIDAKQAIAFADRWKNRLYKGAKSDDQGFVYIPLQGKLLQHRSFQTCAPIDMLRTVLPALNQPAVVTLHPKETYSEAELAALKAVLDEHPNAILKTGQMDSLLPNCSLVITENSSVAFDGYFFEKPTILFAAIDFHHIAQSANPETFRDALSHALTVQPDYAKYLFWFWQIMSINAGRPDAKDRIRARLVQLGWPVA